MSRLAEATVGFQYQLPIGINREATVYSGIYVLFSKARLRRDMAGHGASMPERLSPCHICGGILRNVLSITPRVGRVAAAYF